MTPATRQTAEGKAKVRNTLALPWLLKEVVAFVNDKPLKVSSDLTRMARVSHLWADVALDSLWRVVDIMVVIKLLGPLILTDLGSLTFKTSPSKFDWGRLLYYAPRVRTLTRRGRDDPLSGGVAPWHPLSLEVFCHLHSVALPPSYGGSLLPNLQEINWDIENHECEAQILHFNYPSLKSIEVGNPKSNLNTPQINRIIDSFSHHGARTLETLTIAGERGSSLRKPALEHWIQDQHLLKRLHISGIVIIRPFRVLEHLRCLTAIDITVPHRTDTAASNFTRFLASVAPALTSIEIDFFLHPNDEVALASDPSLRRWSFAAIRPLLVLNGLGTLALVPPVPIVLNDDNIKAMGSSWSKMRNLCLAPEPWAGDRSAGTSLSSIPIFAASLPVMYMLAHYFVGFRDGGSVPSRITALTRNRTELVVNVGLSPLTFTQARRLKKMMADTFSRGKVTVTWNDDDMESDEDQAWSIASEGLYFTLF